jgi:hypothetical protein
MADAPGRNRPAAQVAGRAAGGEAAARDRFHPYIIEIETYAERSTPQDLLGELMLVYQDRHELPDVLILVLRPKGQVEVADHITLQSHGGLTDLRASWRVVELWNVPASELLATGEPGLMPWVPLTRLDGPAPVILAECRRIIDEKAKPEEHRNLLAGAHGSGSQGRGFTRHFWRERSHD